MDVVVVVVVDAVIVIVFAAATAVAVAVAAAAAVVVVCCVSNRPHGLSEGLTAVTGVELHTGSRQECSGFL